MAKELREKYVRDFQRCFIRKRRVVKLRLPNLTSKKKKKKSNFNEYSLMEWREGDRLLKF